MWPASPRRGGGLQGSARSSPQRSCIPLRRKSMSQSDNTDSLLFRLALAQIIFKTWAAKLQALGPAKFTVPLYSH